MSFLLGEELVLLDAAVRDCSTEMAKLAECWDTGTTPPDLVESSSDSRDDLSEADTPHSLYADCFRSRLQAKTKTEALLVSLLAPDV